jgi:hypothetical protein
MVGSPNASEPIPADDATGGYPMTEATACQCGCSMVTDVTNAAEPCGCGCACCSDAPESTEDRVAELRSLRERIDQRLAELETR